MNRTNLAIIGIGHLGSRHLKVFSELRGKVNLTAICDHHPAKAKPLAEQYHIPLFEDYEKLIGRVDAVSICTPTVTHCEIARFFLENKIHAFVEKPMTHTLEEADLLLELARTNNLKLQIGHVERFNSAFQAIAPLARDPLFIECHRLNNFPNRSLDIGVVMD